MGVSERTVIDEDVGQWGLGVDLRANENECFVLGRSWPFIFQILGGLLGQN
jgi:hypothetical protein